MPHILDYYHGDICKDDPSEPINRCLGVYCEEDQQCASFTCWANKCSMNALQSILFVILVLFGPIIIIVVLSKITEVLLKICGYCCKKNRAKEQQ